jgi:hypothetical protein
MRDSSSAAFPLEPPVVHAISTPFQTDDGRETTMSTNPMPYSEISSSSAEPLTAYTGRYTQPDPIGVGFETNPFLYGAANPLRITDPTGLLAEVCCRPTDLARQISHCFIRAEGTTYSLFPEGPWLAARGVPRRDDPRDRNRKDESCVECKPKPCPDFSGTHKDCFEQVHAAYPITGYGFALSSNTYAATLANGCCEGGFPTGFGFTPGANFPPPRLRTRPLPVR